MLNFYLQPQYAYKHLNFDFELQSAYKRFCIFMSSFGDSLNGMTSFYFVPQYAYEQLNFDVKPQYAYKRFCLLMCNVGDS